MTELEAEDAQTIHPRSRNPECRCPDPGRDNLAAAYHPHRGPMSPFACFLVTMFCADDNSLFRVAVRIDTNRHPDADWQHPMEPSTLAAIGSRLPSHASVDSIGPIVEVMEIFEVVP